MNWLRVPRPFSRAQTCENNAFLALLRRTGNARAAARALGAHRAKFTRRRVKHPAFAAEWDAALALAHARLRAGAGAGEQAGDDNTPRIHRLKSGKLQLRRAQPSRIDRDAEQRFLAALSATANIRLSAKAAGFSHSAFYRHRERCPAFAREFRAALELGYLRLEMALLESINPASYRHDAWRNNDPPPIPPMTAGEALLLLSLHQREVRLGGSPSPGRKRGESDDVYSTRLSLIHAARVERSRDAYRMAQVSRNARDGGPPPPHELPMPLLPDLAQVTGWSKATGAPPHDPSRPLFGGWRIGDWDGSR